MEKISIDYPCYPSLSETLNYLELYRVNGYTCMFFFFFIFFYFCDFWFSFLDETSSENGLIPIEFAFADPFLCELTSVNKIKKKTEKEEHFA